MGDEITTGDAPRDATSYNPDIIFPERDVIYQDVSRSSIDPAFAVADDDLLMDPDGLTGQGLPIPYKGPTAHTSAKIFSDFADLICESRSGENNFALLPTCGSTPSQDELFTEGIGKLLKFESKSALTSFCMTREIASATQEEKAMMCLGLADAYFEQGMYERAKNEYLEVLSTDCNFSMAARVYERLMDVGHRMDDIDLIAYAADGLIRTDSDARGREGLELAKVYYRLGNYRESMRIMQEALNWKSKRSVVNDEEFSEFLFWHSFCLLRLGELRYAAKDVTDISDLGKHVARNLFRESGLWVLYQTWKKEGDPESVKVAASALWSLDTDALMHMTTSYPVSPLQPAEMFDFFKDMFEFNYGAVTDLALGKRPGEMEDHFRVLAVVIDALERYFTDYDAHLREKGVNPEWKDALDGIEKLTGIKREQLFKASLETCRYLSEALKNKRLSADDEGKLTELSTFVNFSSSSLFPESIELLISHSKAIRRASEDVDERKKSVNILEESLTRNGFPQGNHEKDFVIEIGVAWREYMEALVHFRRKDGDAIDVAYRRAKEYLERAAGAFPDDSEVWLNLAWFLYTWDKKNNKDFSDSIYFSRAVLDKFTGRPVMRPPVAGIDPSIIDIFMEAKTGPTKRQIAEAKRVLGWSQTKQANREIDYSKFPSTRKNLIEPSIKLGWEARREAVNRRELRDVFYLLAYSQYLLCRSYNENSFQSLAPGPDELDGEIKVPPQNEAAAAMCDKAERYVLDDMYQRGLEHDQSEIYYALGMVKSEVLSLGSLRRFYVNPLFHTGVKEDTYYADLLGFIEKLYPNSKPKPLKEGADAGETLDEIVLKNEHGQVKGMGAIECLLMAFKKEKKENRKKLEIRNTLIKALSYQICLGETELADKQDNLLLIIKLQLDNVRDSEDPQQIDRLKQYIAKAVEWNLVTKRQVPMRYLIEQARALKLNQLRYALPNV